MDIQSKIKESELLAQKVLSEKRFLHCIRTGKCASAMAERFSIDPDKALLAGIVHDICKSMDVDEMLIWVQKDGQPISSDERLSSGLLHGRAAAMYIQDQLDIHDTDIIDAVRHHTSGLAQAAPLTLLVYCADKVEPGRSFETASFRAIGEESGLHAMALAIARYIDQFLRNQGKQPSPASISMIQWLETYETTDSI